MAEAYDVYLEDDLEDDRHYGNCFQIFEGNESDLNDEDGEKEIAINLLQELNGLEIFDDDVPASNPADDTHFEVDPIPSTSSASPSKSTKRKKKRHQFNQTKSSGNLKANQVRKAQLQNQTLHGRRLHRVT